VTGPVEIIIHGDEEFRQPDGGDFVPEPGPEGGQACFVCRGKRLGRIRGQMPAVLLEGDGRIRRQGGEEPIIGGIEAGREPGSRFRRSDWQTRFAEELLAARRPDGVREEEIVELAKPLAAPNPDVAPLDLVPQGGQDGAFVGAVLGGTIGLYKSAQALGETRVRQLLGQGSTPRGVEVTEEGQGVQERRRARGLQGDRQMLQEGGCELPQIAIALHHQGKHGTGVAAQPLLRLLELRLQALRRNRLKHRRAHRLGRHLLIEERVPDRVEAL
jgi:hypothetical protein